MCFTDAFARAAAGKIVALCRIALAEFTERLEMQTVDRPGWPFYCCSIYARFRNAVITHSGIFFIIL